MTPIGIAMELKPGCYDEYKRRHDELWPEMAEVMSANNINMAIYRFNEYLFVYGNAPSQESWDNVGNHSVTPRWNEYMAEVLKTDDEGNIIVHSLPQAFEFGAFKNEA